MLALRLSALAVLRSGAWGGGSLRSATPRRIRRDPDSAPRTLELRMGDCRIGRPVSVIQRLMTTFGSTKQCHGTDDRSPI